MATSIEPQVFGKVANIGNPLRFSNIQPLAGFVAESAKAGQPVNIWTKLAITSDDPTFHRIVEHLQIFVGHMAQQASTYVDLRGINKVLLVLKTDATAELWLDTAAVSISCAVKKSVAAGSVVFEQDITDITAMDFPCVTFGATDKVLCLFREDWRFGLAFDLDIERDFDQEEFARTLGTLCRELRYKHLYDAVKDPIILDIMLRSGWFPFAEIITSEFKEILHRCEAGFNVEEIEDRILANFDNARIQRILERWLSKPHFSAKEDLLSSAMTAFNNRQPIAVIKILLTEIEGILNDAYRAKHNGQGAKLKVLLIFTEESAEHKAGGPDTLLFPKVFVRYLREHTFANFNPINQTGTASSRHAVGHGAASQETYTMTRALQAILTLDQLAFYT